MKFSDFGKLNWSDLGKGLVVAVASAGYVSLKDAITEGRLPTKPELVSAGGVAIAAGAAYLTKNLFTSAPKEVHIDTSKTLVVDQQTKEVIAPASAETVKVN